MELNIWEDIRDRLNLTALGKSAIIGIAALIVMVAVFAGKNIADTATASEFEVDRAQTSEAAASDDGERSIFVHISGSVKKPGLVELPKGSRVADAVNSAGGFSDDARTDSVNLARILEDGEQVYVSPDTDQAEGTAGEPGGAGGSNAAEAGAKAPANGKVNLNTATEAELETLPGIGKSTAAKIVADRQSNGSFKSVDELTRVSGIGDKKLAAIADLVCV